MIRHWFSDVGAFQRDPLGLLAARGRASYSPLAPLALGLRPVVMVVDPALVKPIMRASEDVIGKGALVRKLRKVLGVSSLTMDGEAHRKRREVLHQQLSRGVAQNYIPEMCAIIRQVGIRSAHQAEIPAADLGNKLALKLICIALFGRKVLSEDDEASLIDSVHTLESDLQRDMFRLLPPSPWAAVQQQRVRGKARESLAKILDRVAARAGGTSVLSALLSLQLSRSALRDELLTMLVAGYHTTASAAAWLFYCLAMHPELANRIACEAHATSDSAGEIRPSKLPQASTSLSFVKEVLRLYPAAWWTSRELKQDFEIAERTLRTGTTVIICPWHIHRDPRNHENPEKFSIDRSFAGPAYLPFGTGPRACVGMGVALLELQLIALELASAFEFRVASDSAPQPAAEILLTPPDVSLRMLVRNTRQSKKVA